MNNSNVNYYRDLITEIYTGELNTSESTCSIALFMDAPPVAIIRVLGPSKREKLLEKLSLRNDIVRENFIKNYR